jgi:hypothetical protein
MRLHDPPSIDIIVTRDSRLHAPRIDRKAMDLNAYLPDDVQEQIIAYLSPVEAHRLREVSSLFLRAALRAGYRSVRLDYRKRSVGHVQGHCPSQSPTQRQLYRIQ